MSKAISKFAKDNPDVFTFKAGVVEGRVVALRDVEAIATLPSKEELISKIMFLINAQAQRLVTVISAVPRNLAVVVKQIGRAEGRRRSALNDLKFEISDLRISLRVSRTRKTSGAICQVAFDGSDARGSLDATDRRERPVGSPAANSKRTATLEPF